MTRQILFILPILLSACGPGQQPSTNTLAKTKTTNIDSLQKYQSHFINEMVNEVEPSATFLTKPITAPKVVFIEKTFTLAVKKDDLLKALKIDAQQSGKDFDKIYNIVISYLSSTDSLTFEYIWTKAEDFDDISWFETEKLGAKNLTKKILKETICSLIEKGNFELYENGKREDKYFFERVDSDYGGNVKGVFSRTKRLIWICPPFIVE